MSLVYQRKIGLASGYEDLNDNAQLAKDQMLAITVEKSDPIGMDRVSEKDKGKPLAGIYKRRKPQKTSLWKLFNHHVLGFGMSYGEPFKQQYGFYRPAISHMVQKVLGSHRNQPSSTSKRS